jgi:uncharacterized protein VirK/YbjX
MTSRAEIIQRLKSALTRPSGYQGEAYSYDRLRAQTTEIGPILNELVRAAEEGGYLAKTLSGKYNSECSSRHYLFLYKHIASDRLAHLLDGLRIFEHQSAKAIYTITIECTLEYFQEGELSLDFRVDGVSIFVFSFMFVPGHVVGLADPDAILVSRMQGRLGRYEEVRSATRDMSDCSPQALLFAALQGIARAVGVECMAGTSAANQLCHCDDNDDLFRQAYDNFFNSVDATGPADGFYQTRISRPERPLTSIKSGHRLRTKKKRQLKHTISNAVSLTFAGILKKNINGGLAPLRDNNVEMEQALELAHGVEAENLALQLTNENLRMQVETLRAEKDMLLKSMNREILTDNFLDVDWYLSRYRDVAAAGVDPVSHYLDFGAAEGRSANSFFDDAKYRSESQKARRG